MVRSCAEDAGQIGYYGETGRPAATGVPNKFAPVAPIAK
jgi:hypothetical protein